MVLSPILEKTGSAFDPDHPTNVRTFSKCFAFSPPRQVLKAYYRCDKMFHVDPIRDLFSSQVRKFGLVWVYADLVDVYTFFPTGEMQKIRHISAHLKNSHKHGGQSQKRFERLITQQREGHMKHVCEVISQIFQPIVDDEDEKKEKEKVEHLFFAGASQKKNEMMQNVILKNVPMSIINCSDRDTPIQIVKNLHIHLQQSSPADKTIQLFYAQLHQGSVIYGEEEVKLAVNGGQVKTLISTNEQDGGWCEQFGTTFIFNRQTTNLETRLVREFGHRVGLLRYSISECV